MTDQERHLKELLKQIREILNKEGLSDKDKLFLIGSLLDKNEIKILSQKEVDDEIR